MYYTDNDYLLDENLNILIFLKECFSEMISEIYV